MRVIKEYIRRFSVFLQKDTWPSFIVTLILAFILIKFIFFPGLSFLTGTSLPLVIVESCSMYHHSGGFEKIFDRSNIYEKNNISLNDTANWPFPRGFSKGDVIFVVNPKGIDVGDVLIFNAGAVHPLIHRVVKADDTYATKGDNYRTNSNQLSNEKKIEESQLVGRALFKIPAIGWIKLIFFEASRPPRERGLC